MKQANRRRPNGRSSDIYVNMRVVSTLLAGMTTLGEPWSHASTLDNLGSLSQYEGIDR
jgi:hypothetical protein